MYKVIKILTNDGSCFDTEVEAKKYVEVQYGNQLTMIANKLLQQGKYVSMCEFLEENLNLFETLIELKNEINDSHRCKFIDDIDD